MLKKRLALCVLCLLVAVSASAIVHTKNTYAAGNYDLISNNVYLDKNSMTQAQIQSFLANKNSSLTTYKDQGINDSSPQLASTLIYNAAQAWGINPQVILATLQKEQSLVTNPSPASVDYRAAMGYGCPDGADCNAAYYGFANQVNIAAYQFRYNYEVLKGNTSFVDGDGDIHGVGSYACNQATSFYNKPLLPGNTVTFTRNTAISGTQNVTVTIADEATASLLCYTPHVGPYNTTGYSGSDNFVYWFTQWFGSPLNPGLTAIENKYAALPATTQSLLGAPSGSLHCNLVSSGCYQMYQNGGAIIWTSKTGAWESYNPIRNRWGQLGYETGELGFPTGSIAQISNGGYYQKYKNGYIVGSSTTGTWESKGGIRTRWGALGYEDGIMGYPTGPEVRMADGGYYQKYQNGYILWKSGLGAWESKGGIRTRWGALNYQDGIMGYPTGPEVRMADGGYYQKYQNGYILWSAATRGWESYGPIRSKWGELNYQAGKLGYPTSGITTSNGIMQQHFQGGTISYNQKTRLATVTYAE